MAHLDLHSGTGQKNNLCHSEKYYPPEKDGRRPPTPDKRSYRVSFDLFKSLAPDYQPLYTLKKAIEELQEGLTAMNFKDGDFRNSLLMRLKVLTSLQDNDKINTQLEWNHKKVKTAEPIAAVAI